MKDNNKKIAVIVIISIVIFGFIYISFASKKQNSLVIDANSNSQQLENSQQANETSGETQAGSPKATQDVTTVSVYVTGAVNNPGVYSLSSNDRIEDAITAAGGATDSANLEDINLAEHLVDAEHIVVPTIGENNSEVKTGSNQTSEDSGLININTASEEELTKLPGIGEVTANKIVSYREENGPFETTEDIKKVDGIGDKTYDDIKDLITV